MTTYDNDADTTCHGAHSLLKALNYATLLYAANDNGDEPTINPVIKEVYELSLYGVVDPVGLCGFLLFKCSQNKNVSQTEIINLFGVDIFVASKKITENSSIPYKVNDDEGVTKRHNNIQLLLKAADFAAHKHRNQRRKNERRSPYIEHPIHVAYTLSQCGVNDINVLCGSLLHDTVEDTETSLGEIEAKFGKKIAKIVSDVTDDKSLHKIERKRLQIEHTQEPGHILYESKLVKLGDKFSNLSSLQSTPPKNWTHEEITGYAVWCYKVCLNLRNVNTMMDSLLETVFKDFGLYNIENERNGELLNELLEQYYKCIFNSE
ncbi:MAG: hypothetical protein Terrestrivirus10_40 [Terrestrivirus sp.]|uniref:HD domain-containing protein n=1 Tax=Terrestrivirus sp. TaxID=2487775 RepID=A0A3G4ZP49_9VIRU|nr:MAG: hypothetical protein Terrestrivirus10_40 [Terrestrivirus sp.]